MAMILPSDQANSGEPAKPKGKKFAVLSATHEEYDAGYWQTLRALYEGGKTLLRNQALLEELFPRHRNEIQEVYAERKKRALYIPYPAEIIDHLIAALSADPLGLTINGDTAEELPKFYRDFVDNVAPRGGEKISLNELVAQQMRTALQTKMTWSLVDLPAPDPGLTPSAPRADQERAGLLNAYVLPIDPESVIDWEEDSSGQLIWAMVHLVESKRLSIDESRSNITQRWKYYTRTTWTEYRITHDRKKPPNPDDVIPEVASGDHSFTRVPLVRLQLPEGLWAMNKLESLAREHFNKRSALSFAEIQALLPELYEYLQNDASNILSTIGEDPNRHKNQRRGQGYVQVRAEKDRAEFVGPAVEPFTEARMSCDATRDDMHRVMHQMALSTPNSAAAMQRSAESKQQDTAAVDVVLGALGLRARKHAEEIAALAALGRGEKDLADQWKADGMDEFDSVAVSSAIADGLSLESIRIESPTFRKRWLMKLIGAVLGEDMTPEDRDAIAGELEDNVTNESVLPPPPDQLGARPPRTIPPGGRPAGTGPKKPKKPTPPGK